MDNVKMAPHDTFVSLPPIYLSVRRDILLHIGVGDPDNAENYQPIIDNVIVYPNNVTVPFLKIFDEKQTLNVPNIPSPCQDGTTITGFADVYTKSVVASGTYSPVLYSDLKGLLDGSQEFLGLHQCIMTTQKPIDNDTLHFDILVELENGDGILGGTGYTSVVFAPDPGSDPNSGTPQEGTYFFNVIPKAKIISHDPHN